MTKLCVFFLYFIEVCGGSTSNMLRWRQQSWLRSAKWYALDTLPPSGCKCRPLASSGPCSPNHHRTRSCLCSKPSCSLLCSPRSSPTACPFNGNWSHISQVDLHSSSHRICWAYSKWISWGMDSQSSLFSSSLEICYVKYCVRTSTKEIRVNVIKYAFRNFENHWIVSLFYGSLHIIFLILLDSLFVHLCKIL